MENAITRKVNRIGLAGQIVSIVLIVLTAVGCAALLALGIGLSVLPKDAVNVGVSADMDITVGKGLLGKYMDEIPDDPSELNAVMNVNGTEYTNIQTEKTADGLVVRAASDRMEFNLKRLASTAFAGLAYCAVYLVVFVFLKRLADGFRRCDSPFSDDVIHRMTVFAWVLLIGSVVASGAEATVNSLIARSLDLQFSLNPSGLNSGVDVSFSFAPILVALLVMFLTMIFRYGAQLQKESDETL